MCQVKDHPRPDDREQARTLRFIEDFFAINGCTPTVLEVCEGLGLLSSSSGHLRIQRLVRAGYLRRVGRRLALVHWRGSDERW